MLFSGYLKVIHAELKHTEILYTIAIPNREVASKIQYIMLFAELLNPFIHVRFITSGGIFMNNFLGG